jgi:hypothetical protein
MLLLAGSLIAATGCGGKDFANRPRPPVPIELTGVIQDQKVTVSPAKVGGGPILITISNQTKDAHTVTLEGESIQERVGPINPLDTATIQKTVKQGRYKVSAGSAKAVAKEIKPAVLTIGKDRANSSNEVSQP